MILPMPGGVQITAIYALVDPRVLKYQRGSNNFQGCGPGSRGRPF
jgi:hypothetical protein